MRFVNLFRNTNECETMRGKCHTDRQLCAKIVAVGSRSLWYLNTCLTIPLQLERQENSARVYVSQA